MSARSFPARHSLSRGIAAVAMAMAATVGWAQTQEFTAPPPHTATMSVVVSQDQIFGKGWYWVPIAGAKCRYNADTGIAVRWRKDASKVLITLQGGGVCFNGGSCTANIPWKYGVNEFQDAVMSGAIGTKLGNGVWKLTPPHDPQNPNPPAPNTDTPNVLADQFTEVFIPYCSGDMHVGNNTQSYVFPYGNQNFQGAKNTQLYYQYVVDKLLKHDGSPQQVVLSGFSAGALGATLTAGRLRNMLPSNTQLSLVSDSGPLFKQTTTEPIDAWKFNLTNKSGSRYETIWRACLQKRFHDTWGLANSVMQDCGPTCTASNWMYPMFEKLLRSHADVSVALLSSTHDYVLRAFMWATVDDSCGWDPTHNQYKDGLEQLRTEMKNIRGANGNIATYFISSPDEFTGHGALQNQRYFALDENTASENQKTRLQTWTEKFLGYPRSALTHVGP